MVGDGIQISAIYIIYRAESSGYILLGGLPPERNLNVVDLYYTDLARSVLHKAVGSLQSGQEYIVRAGLSNGERERVQRIINSIRREIDAIGMSAQQAVAAELLPPRFSTIPCLQRYLKSINRRWPAGG